MCGRFVKGCNGKERRSRGMTMERQLNNEPKQRLPRLSFLKACNAEAISNEEISFWLIPNAYNAAASDVEGFVCGRLLKACNTEAIKNRRTTMARPFA